MKMHQFIAIKEKNSENTIFRTNYH